MLNWLRTTVSYLKRIKGTKTNNFKFEMSFALISKLFYKIINPIPDLAKPGSDSLVVWQCGCYYNTTNSNPFIKCRAVTLLTHKELLYSHGAEVTAIWYWAIIIWNYNVNLVPPSAINKLSLQTTSYLHTVSFHFHSTLLS